MESLHSVISMESKSFWIVQNVHDTNRKQLHVYAMLGGRTIFFVAHCVLLTGDTIAEIISI